MKPFKGPPTYAAIPGTGPAGRTCGQCCHRRIYDSRGKHTDWVCQKTAEMPIAPPSRLGEPDVQSPACRYYQAKTS